MATYVNDLRLKEISTGDESGTWGTSTNTNLELIGEALGYATEQSFGSDADATTTVADGVSDPARAMYFKVTSAVSLTATRTLTIAPNTVSRVMFIENATSGSQSIAISQGSGANVTIATGKTAIVYLDGAGSGAAVVDAMAGVDPGVTDTLAEVLTAGNATGGTDIAVGTGDDITFADDSKAIFGAGSDLQIFHSGTHSIIRDNGTGDLRIEASDDIFLRSVAGETYARFRENLGVELYYDDNEKFSTTSTGIDVTGTVTADGLNLDGNIQGDTGQNMQVSAGAGTGDKLDLRAGDDVRIYVDGATAHKLAANFANNGDVSLYEDTGTTAKFFWYSSAESLGIGTTSPSGLLHVASTGAANIKIEDTDNGFAATELNVENGGRDFKITTPQDTIFVQGSTEAMRILDGGNVGIGTSSPVTLKSSTTLQVDGNAKLGDDNGRGLLSLGDIASTGANAGIWRGAAGAYAGTGNFLNLGGYDGITFTTGNADISSQTEAMRIDSSGRVGIGTSPSQPLHVDATGGTTAALFDNNGTNGDVVRVGKNGTDILKIRAEGTADVALDASGGAFIFKEGGSEAMRLDASGNLLVGTTDTDTQNNNAGSTADNGFVYNIGSGGYLNVARYGGTVAYFNRTSTNGTIADFRKDGSTVASIGSNSGLPYFAGTSIGLKISGTQIRPSNSAGNNNDDAVDLGKSDTRFKDLYLSGTANVGNQLKFNAHSGYDERTIGLDSTGLFVYNTTDSRYDLSIDGSGNLLVGKTSASGSTVGGEIRATGAVLAVRDGDFAGYFNRKTSAGEIVRFVKDTTTVGSIGTRGDDVYLETGDTGIRMYDQSDAIIPVGSTGVSRDAAIDLGISNIRFKDLYLSSSVLVNAAVPRVTLTDTDGTNTIGDIRQASDATVIKSRNGSSNGSIKFAGEDGTTETEYARFNASGDLLVGTTDTFVGDNATGGGISFASGGAASFARSAGTVMYVNRTGSSAGEAIEFRYNGGDVGNISVTASATAFNTSSDQRLKENIADADDAGSKVDAIQVRKFDWIADGSHQDYGMVAQELVTVAPEAVTGDADSDEMMGVDYSKLVPMLVKEIQSLRARVQQLENN